MIPFSINLHHNQFTFIILGEGMMEILFEEIKQGFQELAGIYVGSGTMKLLLPCKANPAPIKHECPDKWVDVMMTYEAACSLLEWARYQKARAIFDLAPNKSNLLAEGFGKRIILPDELRQAWESRKR